MRTILFTVLLLVVSNTFMTIAWYGHLKHKDKSLLAVILVSWLIALPEYAFQVPANRMGSAVMTGTQLKLIQEIVTLFVFVMFAWYYLDEKPTWRTAAAFALVALAVALVRNDAPKRPIEESVPAEAQAG
jgi:uncharacterized protein